MNGVFGVQNQHCTFIAHFVVIHHQLLRQHVDGQFGHFKSPKLLRSREQIMSEKKESADKLNVLTVKKPTTSLLTLGGNATGSGRNKVALKPGFSLVGWVKHASSNDNLSGITGPRIDVTLDELKKHDQPDDCWMAIRGKVYNVTAYVDYHPGGVEELMRGAGTNATELFDETHSYVNFETLLQKCYVGRLVGYD